MRLDEANYTLDLWLRWQPRAIPPRMMRADSLRALRDRPREIETYREMLAIDSDQMAAHRELGRALLEDNAALRCEAVDFLLDQGRNAEARLWLISALRCDRQHAAVRRVLVESVVSWPKRRETTEGGSPVKCAGPGWSERTGSGIRKPEFGAAEFRTYLTNFSSKGCRADTTTICLTAGFHR